MIVVSDTTPLHYLILIEQEELLPALFGEIIIPEAVFEEMQHENTPAAVRLWMDFPPDWIIVKTINISILERIGSLGKGETEAIAIALQENADSVLMDDRKAIREARKNGLVVITLFGILELAAIKNLIDLPKVLDELIHTSFRMPPEEIVKTYLERDKQRKEIK